MLTEQNAILQRDLANALERSVLVLNHVEEGVIAGADHTKRHLVMLTEHLRDLPNATIRSVLVLNQSRTILFWRPVWQAWILMM